MGGGAPKEEQQKQQLSWDNLNQIFRTLSDTAQQHGISGRMSIDQARNYFQRLLGGRQAQMQAAQPAISAAREQTDAAKAERAKTGTSRTGGDVAENVMSEDQLRSEIDRMLGTLAPAAAGQLADLGKFDVEAFLQSMNIATGATGEAGRQISSDINSRRQASAAMWSSLVSGGLGVAGAFLGRPKLS